MPHRCETDSETCDSLFRQWGIENALTTCSTVGYGDKIKLKVKLPNSSARPYFMHEDMVRWDRYGLHTIVHLNTPPNAMSSPNTTAVSSLESAILAPLGHDHCRLTRKMAHLRASRTA